MALARGPWPTFADLDGVQRKLVVNVLEQLRSGGTWPTVARIAQSLDVDESKVTGAAAQHGDIFVAFEGCIGLTLKGLFVAPGTDPEQEAFEDWVNCVRSKRLESTHVHFAPAELRKLPPALRCTLMRSECGPPAGAPDFWLFPIERMPNSGPEWLGERIPWDVARRTGISAEDLRTALGRLARANKGVIDRRRAAWLYVEAAAVARTAPAAKALEALRTELAWSHSPFAVPRPLSPKTAKALFARGDSLPQDAGRTREPAAPTVPRRVVVHPECVRVDREKPGDARTFDSLRLGSTTPAVPARLLQFIALYGVVTTNARKLQVLRVQISKLRDALEGLGIDRKSIVSRKSEFSWCTGRGGDLAASEALRAEEDENAPVTIAVEEKFGSQPGRRKAGHKPA